MFGVNIPRIYMELARRYKYHRFEVYSDMTVTGTSPVETLIEFRLPENTQVDQVKLGKIFDKYISNVQYFNFMVENGSIYLMLHFHKKKNMLGIDYEFSLN